MRATVNPRNNLAHCFCCAKNLNNIDLLMTLDYDFRAAVALLERWLKQYQAQQVKPNGPRAHHCPLLSCNASSPGQERVCVLGRDVPSFPMHGPDSHIIL